MSIYSQYQTDKNKETNGVEIESGINNDGTVPTFIISRSNRNNKVYAATLEAETKPVRRMLELKTLPPEKADAIFLKVFVKSILRGWRNVYDENEQPLPFNEENAIKLMNDLPDLYDELQDASKAVANFRFEALENEAKN